MSRTWYDRPSPCIQPSPPKTKLARTYVCKLWLLLRNSQTDLVRFHIIPLTFGMMWVYRLLVNLTKHTGGQFDEMDSTVLFWKIVHIYLRNNKRNHRKQKQLSKTIIMMTHIIMIGTIFSWFWSRKHREAAAGIVSDPTHTHTLLFYCD